MSKIRENFKEKSMKLQNAINDKLSIILAVAMFVLIMPLITAAQDKIAYSSCGVSDGSCEIYLMNPDGSNQMNLTNHAGNDLTPSIKHKVPMAA